MSNEVGTEKVSGLAPLAFSDLTVQHGTVVALHEVTLEMRPRERVALIGPSGSGKSSLLHTAAGLVTPTSGAVEVLGQPLSQLTGAGLQRHRQRVGIVSQNLGLAQSLRVIHSVNGGQLGNWSTPRALASLVRPVGRTEVEQVLQSVDLADRIDARTGDLSGGEQQRIAVARTLYQRPELLLADEPTSSLDPELADRIMSLLCADDAPWATLFSAHDPDLAIRHADRVIGLSSGSVAFDSPADQVDPADVSALYDNE